MIALLVRLGLSDKVAKLVAYVGIPLLILGAFYLTLDAYGDAKFDAGKDQADKEWKAAADLVDAQSQGAADAADIPADQRAADWAARVEQEKARLNETINEGGDPFDVLFPAVGGSMPAPKGGDPVSP